MPVDIPVSRLAEICNPFRHSPWDTKVSRRQVAQALKERRLVSTPGGDDHAGRIAYLIENPANDAIEIDVGIPSMGCFPAWPVTDGNHRLAAAIHSNRPVVSGSVSGCLDHAESLFGIDCTEPC